MRIYDQDYIANMKKFVMKRMSDYRSNKQIKRRVDIAVETECAVLIRSSNGVFIWIIFNKIVLYLHSIETNLFYRSIVLSGKNYRVTVEGKLSILVRVYFNKHVK